MGQKKTYEELEAQVKKLERDNQYLKKIFDSLPVNVFVKDVNCTYAFTNKICDMVNGVERGGLIGKSDFDLQESKEIAQNFYDDDLKIMKTKRGSRNLSPTMCGDEVKYYDIFKEPVLDDEDKVIGIIGMVVAPEEWGLGQERFAQNYKEYKNIFQDLESFVFDYDMNSQKVIVLRKIDGFHFFDDGKMLLQNMIDMENIYKEDIIMFKNVFEKIHAGGDKESVVIRFYDTNRCLKWCRLSLNAVYDSHMKSIHAVGMIRPLSDSVVESEQMRIAIEDVNKQLANVLGNRYDSFMYFNLRERYYHVIGLKNNNLMHGLKHTGTFEEFKEFCEKYIYKEDLTTCLSIIHSFAKENNKEAPKDFFSAEFRFLGDNGEYRWKEVDIYQVNKDFKEGIILTTFDVDEVVKENHNQKFKEINNGIIDILSTVVEFRSIESGNHIKRMKGFTKILLKYVNAVYENVYYSRETMEVISSAAAMHDVGKVAIPDSILLKPGRLTSQEYEMMKEHTIKGCEILDSMSALQDENYYKYSYEICRYHHERYDGKGYPEGLIGDEIPLAAQVVAVADVYDALVSKRVYKDAYSHEEAFQMIMRGECGAFDPRLLECFVHARAEMEILSREYGD